MKKNGFDWFLLLLFVSNVILSIFTKNTEAAMGWACSTLTLGRILVNNFNKDEKIPSYLILVYIYLKLLFL